MTSQEANSIPLEDILSYYGHNPSRHFGGYDMYSSPFRRDSSPSFKVFKEENRWYDFGEGTHGRAVESTFGKFDEDSGNRSLGKLPSA